MQSNPFLTVLKILAFAVLAFLVCIPPARRPTSRTRSRASTGRTSATSRSEVDGPVPGDSKVGRLQPRRRAGAGAGGTGPAGSTRIRGVRTGRRSTPTADPSQAPSGTPGRYKDFLSPDPDPEYPPEAAALDRAMLGALARRRSPKGFNFVTENDGTSQTTIELYVRGLPARRQWTNPSKYRPVGLLARRGEPRLPGVHALLPQGRDLAPARRRPPRSTRTSTARTRSRRRTSSSRST